jgi:type I restriction-modification system DNA methylase subunit
MSNKRTKSSSKKRAKIVRTADRIKKYGEVFTPKKLVIEMLDALPADSFTDASKTFMDPSCGNGAFLIEVVKKKIANGIIGTLALHTTYGIEILSDNAEECRQNLLDVVGDTPLHRAIVDNNIKCADALKFDMSKMRPYNLDGWIIANGVNSTTQVNINTRETFTSEIKLVA